MIFMFATLMASTAALGTSGARCAPGETGPSIRVVVDGLKDRTSTLVVEVYPDNDADFLKDDNILIAEGKVFRRVSEPVPSDRVVSLCVRVPAPGRYAVAVTHDRDGKRSFSLSSDGVGFAGNPKLRFSRPNAASASLAVGQGPALARIVMNYRRGLFSFGPLDPRN